MRLKTNKPTKRSIYWASLQCTQLCFSVESLSPCGGRHLRRLHSHAVEVFIFFWLWEVQILQYTRDDVTSDCCQKAPFVCLLPPLHVGFLSSEPAVLQPGLRGSGSKRGAFLLPLSALLLTIFPHPCTEAINRREELRHTWLQYLIGRFLCQAPLPFEWVLMWPDSGHWNFPFSFSSWIFDALWPYEYPEWPVINKAKNPNKQKKTLTPPYPLPPP